MESVLMRQDVRGRLPANIVFIILLLEIARQCDMDADNKPPSDGNLSEEIIAESSTDHNQDSYSTAS